MQDFHKNYAEIFMKICLISLEKHVNMKIFSRSKHALTLFLRATTAQANGDISLIIKWEAT